MVPMLRTIGSPIPAASSASAGIALATSRERATEAWVTIAPMVTELASTWMARRSAMPPRSTSVGADASRSLIDCTRLWPPAR